MKPYRRNASAVVLLPSDDGYRVLLLRKPRSADAWQLPQGGIEDGETVEQAALRELREEAGIRTGALLGGLTPTYRYDYPEGFRRFPEYRGQQVSFVAVLLRGPSAVTVDGTEIVGHAWALHAALSSFLARADYLRLVASLVDEAGALASSAPA